MHHRDRPAAFRSTDRRGFTLVELLVTIGILAVLVAFLIPSALRAIESSRSAGCFSNMRQVSAALLSYSMDHNSFLPLVYPSGGGSPWWGEALAEQSYIPPIPSPSRRCNSILFCPASTAQVNGLWVWTNGNYGLNRHLAGNGSYGSSAGIPPVSLVSLAKPAQTILMLDAGTMGLLYTYSRNPGFAVSYIPGSSHNEGIAWRDNARKDALEGRHGGKVHVCYVDGHIEVQSADGLEDSRLWLGR